ncbi:DUF6514 family protein [Clostridium sp. DL1XJH146]
MLIVDNKEKLLILDNKEIKYIYRVIKSNFYIEDQEEIIQSYGIEIERQDIVDGSIKNIERENIKHISPQRHKVGLLMEQFYNSALSPLHLIEAVDEKIEFYICDYDNIEKNKLSC